MTHEHIKALNALIDAVERGGPNKNDGTLYLLFGDDWVHAWDVIGWGSLDAAKALHDALLPDQLWEITPLGNVYIRDIEYNQLSRAFVTSNPARAWLIAILKAYRAQMAA